MIQFIRLTNARAVGGLIVDAALGAVCGALCGMSIGSFRLRVPGGEWNMLPVVGYWALCVAFIAVVIGTINRIFEVHESSDRTVAPPLRPSSGRRTGNSPSLSYTAVQTISSPIPPVPVARA
ncbi:MAG TPA: hypothetical protein VGM05_26645 [Planctomycetaceae bacterium]|jgi:hypothetical protein